MRTSISCRSFKVKAVCGPLEAQRSPMHSKRDPPIPRDFLRCPPCHSSPAYCNHRTGHGRGGASPPKGTLLHGGITKREGHSHSILGTLLRVPRRRSLFRLKSRICLRGESAGLSLSRRPGSCLEMKTTLRSTLFDLPRTDSNFPQKSETIVSLSIFLCDATILSIALRVPNRRFL
jgi:hypothetical protein